MNKFIILLRLLSAGILLQTLFFKFTGAPESVYIFSQLGVEPFGRYFAGLSELVASLLLAFNATYVLGALMSIGIMAGALLSHILVLGIVVQNDDGLLFALALIVSLSSALIVFFKKSELQNLPFIGPVLGKYVT